ncbi:MAG: hypothetical protein WKF81_03900 [Thermomicrobiales bacterium]
MTQPRSKTNESISYSRTTIYLANDVLDFARYMSKSSGETMGVIISDLVRKTLTLQEEPGVYDPELGATLLPPVRRSVPLTAEEIIQIQDDSE